MATFKEVMTEALRSPSGWSGDLRWLQTLAGNLQQATETPNKAKGFVEKFAAVSAVLDQIHLLLRESTTYPPDLPAEKKTKLLGLLNALEIALDVMVSSAEANHFLAQFAKKIHDTYSLVVLLCRSALLGGLSPFAEIDPAGLDTLFKNSAL